MGDVRLTRHAIKRGKERLRLNKSALLRTARIARDRGTKRIDTTGDLRWFLDKITASQADGADVRLLGEIIYIFCDEYLLTVYHLLPHYRKLVNKMNRS